MEVWFKEAEQKVGTNLYSCRTSADGMVSQFIIERTATGQVSKHTYEGETSLHDAMREFTDRVLWAVYK